MDDQVEIWREIPGYESLYSVSNLGRVRSDRTITNSKAGSIKNADVTYAGYHRVNLCKSGIHKKYAIHRLVALMFIGPCPDGLEVNHKDGCKDNNSVGNLEYVTESENKKHAFRLGLRTQTGSRNSMHKLTEDSVRKIRSMYVRGVTRQRDIADLFGVTRTAVGSVILGKGWKHVKEDDLCQKN
jgi:hypothetical protein